MEKALKADPGIFGEAGGEFMRLVSAPGELSSRTSRRSASRCNSVRSWALMGRVVTTTVAPLFRDLWKVSVPISATARASYSSVEAPRRR